MKNWDRNQTHQSLDHLCCAAYFFLWTTVLGWVRQCWCSCFCSGWGFWVPLLLSWCSASLLMQSSSQEACSGAPQYGTAFLGASAGHPPAAPLQCCAEWQRSPDPSTSHCPEQERWTFISSSAFSCQNHTPSSDVGGMELNSTSNSTPLILCTQEKCKNPKTPTCSRWVLIVNSQVPSCSYNQLISFNFNDFWTSCWFRD